MIIVSVALSSGIIDTLAYSLIVPILLGRKAVG
jgi:hypothetical protein